MSSVSPWPRVASLEMVSFWLPKLIDAVGGVNVVSGVPVVWPRRKAGPSWYRYTSRLPPWPPSCWSLRVAPPDRSITAVPAVPPGASGPGTKSKGSSVQRIVVLSISSSWSWPSVAVPPGVPSSSPTWMRTPPSTQPSSPAGMPS